MLVDEATTTNRALLHRVMRYRLSLDLSFCVTLGAFVALYIQLYIKLAAGPWRTEQEGHGPFLLAAAAFIAYLEYKQHRQALFTAGGRFGAGLALVVFGSVLAVVGESQDVTMLAAGSQVVVLAGLLVARFGWRSIKIMGIPLLLVAAATPPPGYLVDSLTVPLKQHISDAVVGLLYRLGFDIAQNGVVIQAGPYQLLVKDACAGMNSLFALSALSVIYVYIRSDAPVWHKALLILLSLPAAVVSNFFRVLLLCLVTFEAGLGGEESLHDVTGILLFVVAGLLLFAADMVLTGGRRLAERFRGRRYETA